MRFSLLFFLACSSAPPPTVDGVWSGSWQSTTSATAGDVLFSVSENGSTTHGTGTVSLYGSVTLDGTYGNGKWLGTVRGALGTATFDLNVSGGAASGSYRVPGDTGIVSPQRRGL